MKPEFKPMQKKPEQGGCQHPANFTYTWPGSPMSCACMFHMQAITELAGHMGVPVTGLNVTILSSMNVNMQDRMNAGLEPWPICENMDPEEEAPDE